jgi:hypothetical protein
VSVCVRWQPGGEEESRTFFFEKKKQKTFIHLASAFPEGLGPGSKAFWFFFSKKNCFLAYAA